MGEWSILMRCVLTVVLSGVAAATLAAGTVVTPAHAEFGDGYGVTDANNGPEQPGADVSAQAFPGVKAWWAGTCDLAAGSASNGGIGTPPAIFANCIDHGRFYNTPAVVDPDPPLATVWQPGSEPQWRLDPVTQAGSHPDATGSFWLNRYHESFGTSLVQGDGDTRTIKVGLPAGLVGDPTAVPKCPSAALQHSPPRCPPATQVGTATLTLGVFDERAAVQSVYPVWNVEARDGKTAELMLSPAASEPERANIPIVAKARTDGDFGVDALAVNIPAGVPLLGQSVTLWGVPWAASHDAYRTPIDYQGPGGFGGAPETGLPDARGNQPQSYDPSWGPIRPFLTLPTECDPVLPITALEVSSWQRPDLPRSYDAPADAQVEGCASVPFAPSASFVPSSTAADSASGLDARIDIPQHGDAPLEVPQESASPAVVQQYVADATSYWSSPAGLGTAQLDKTVVNLPEGMSVNPSGAAGLKACSDAQMGVRQVGNPYLFDNTEPSCPGASRIGTVEATTPLLEGSPNLTGDVFLGTPKSTDPASGQMLRLFLVLRNTQRGLLAKIYGSSVADPATGRLTATFDRNPRVPVESIEVSLKGGSRGLLAMPQACGEKSVQSQFTPWTAAHGGGGPIRDLVDEFTVGGDCSSRFSPKLAAAMSTRTARGTGVFSVKLTRNDGEQWLRGLTAVLPPGLLASLKGVPLCRSAEAAAGTCPAASRIGSVDAAAGSGAPFVLERKGTAYLTQGYKGCAYGLSVVVPVVAGPFDASSPQTDLGKIVVRQSVCVDPIDAQVTVTSDPFPTIHRGIPLRVRSVTVNVDRAGFMRNPSDCSPKEVGTDFVSTEGARASAVQRFQVSGCGALAFKPRLAMRLTGRNQMRSNGHPGVRAVVTQKAGEAGIERAEVRLPRSLALDPDNARALCEFVDGTKPDLENYCPKGSIVGRARAVSPLLNRPLSGNVYFVKNVRTDPDTGAQIRTLPMIVAALRGEIAINLRGESDVKGPRLVNTFDQVPDAPVSQFNLNIAGGKRGILVVTENRRGRINLCARAQIAEADIDAHNGKRHDRNVKLKTACKKTKKKSKQKRSARAHRRATRS
jgi:hypothetical protein